MSGSEMFSLIFWTMALPTTMASATSRDFRACSGVEIPNPTATGNFVCARICPHLFAYRRGDTALGAGHAFAGDVVNEPGRSLANLLNSRRRRGRRDQADVQRTLSGSEILFRRKVQNQKAVDTRLVRLAVELVRTQTGRSGLR